MSGAPHSESAANDSPVLALTAAIISKRAIQYFQSNAGDNMAASSSAIYYATFEVESGRRMELKADGQEYGMLAEEDRLTFQGPRYLGFECSRG